MGEKTRTGSDGAPLKAWDHDPPAKVKMVPFGFLVLMSGALMLVFGLRETSDSWADALQLWWDHVRSRFPNITRLVIYLDNGPQNSGNRTQFLKRMIQFADWSGLEIRLVYYPPYHSKYNPVERCWSSLARKWSGVLLNSMGFVMDCARRMTWRGQPPELLQLPSKDYPTGVKLTCKQMRPWEKRLERSTELPKYDITIKPQSAVN